MINIHRQYLGRLREFRLSAAIQKATAVTTLIASYIPISRQNDGYEEVLDNINGTINHSDQKNIHSRSATHSGKSGI